MRRNNPLISIIIPIYNVEKFLPTCLDSVIKQTYKNLEILLVNDGSTDGSNKICDDYVVKDRRIKIINKKNAGVASARNFALKKATGAYIMFVDADDALNKKCVEKCVDVAISKEVDIAKFSYKKKTHFIKKVYKYNTLTGSIIKKKDFDNKIFSKIFCNYDFTNVWTMLIKSNIAKNISFRNYLCGEDFLYSAECISKSSSIYIIGEPLYEYTINWSSATHVFNVAKLIDELKVLNEVADIARTTKGLDDRIKNSLYANIVNCAIIYGYEDYRKYLENIPLEKFVDKNEVLSKIFYYKTKFCNFHKVILMKGKR